MHRESSVPDGSGSMGIATSAETGRMSEPNMVSTSTSAHRLPSPVASALEIFGTYLSPADPFPSTLAELELAELHMLHSRVARQLDREYRTDPTGPHPVTLDRVQELMTELDTRQDFLAPAGPTPPAGSRVNATGAYQGAATAGRPAAPPPMSATMDRTDAARTGPLPPTTPRQTRKRSDGPPGARKKASSNQTRCEAETPIQDLDRLRPGHQIEVWYRGQKQCVGTVDEIASSLGVVWVREALDGYRRMVDTQDTELRHHLPATPV